MIKLFILFSEEIKLANMDSFLLKSFKVLGVANNCVAIQATFKSTADAVLFVACNDKTFVAVTEDKKDADDWIKDA